MLKKKTVQEWKSGFDWAKKRKAQLCCHRGKYSKGIRSQNHSQLCSALYYYMCSPQSPEGYLLGILSPSVSGHHITCWGFRIDMKKNEIEWQSALWKVGLLVCFFPPRFASKASEAIYSSGKKCKDPSLEKLKIHKQKKNKDKTKNNKQQIKANKNKNMLRYWWKETRC